MQQQNFNLMQFLTAVSKSQNPIMSAAAMLSGKPGLAQALNVLQNTPSNQWETYARNALKEQAPNVNVDNLIGIARQFGILK